ncbi:MAG: SRPBCC domain-containing protein [Phycisphaeraceae bacterium]|nr:SRPBCC domain-containing protein [Phycisphaeraceae bacterium]
MSLTIERDAIQTIRIQKDIHISAPPEIAFAALLEELGPGSVMPDGTPFPMTIEPWPGGRWFRDRGTSGEHPWGHLWGHVQVIRAPFLLELTGPMMMSYAAVNHVQYRLTTEGAGTTLTLTHRAMGIIPQEHQDGMQEGWAHGLESVKRLAELKVVPAGH